MLKTRRSPFLVPVAAFLLLAGTTCTVLEPGDSTRPPTYAPFDGEIGFDVRESYTNISAPGEPRIQLAMRTMRAYPCSNWRITHAVESPPGAVHVDLGGIYKPEICLTSIGPARGTTFLDLASGTYELAFSNGGCIDRFTLTVTDAALEITPSAATAVQPLHPRIWRYPRNSLAYVCGTTTTTTAMCEECLSQIRDAGDLQEVHFPPNGLVPYPTASSGYWVNTPARYFTYADDAAFQRAANALAAYARDVIGSQQGIGISMWNWRNELVASWIPPR